MIPKVFIDGKDTYTEYGLLLASKAISLPKVRTNMIDVPGRDGLIDASDALTGEATYKNRAIKLELVGIPTLNSKEWPDAVSDFCNAVHGKRVKVKFSEDTAHYYSGRCSVGDVDLKKLCRRSPLPLIAIHGNTRTRKQRCPGLIWGQHINSLRYRMKAALLFRE